MHKTLSNDTENKDQARQTATILLENMGVGQAVLTSTLFFLATHSWISKQLSNHGEKMQARPGSQSTNPLDISTQENLQHHGLVISLNTRLNSLKTIEDVITASLQNLRFALKAQNEAEPRELDYNLLMESLTQSETLKQVIKRITPSASTLKDMSAAFELVKDECQSIPTYENVSSITSETSKQPDSNQNSMNTIHAGS